MKKMYCIILLLSVFFIFDQSLAQRLGMPDEEGRPGPERLNRFRKMRLIEVLKLNEEESVRFFARQSAHEDNVHDLMKSRNDLLDDMQKTIKEKGDGKDLPNLTDQVLAIDQKIFTERQRYQDEVKKSLTPEQFAKFLIFERNFGRQVRDAMDEMRHDRRRDHEE